MLWISSAFFGDKTQIIQTLASSSSFREDLVLNNNIKSVNKGCTAEEIEKWSRRVGHER